MDISFVHQDFHRGHRKSTHSWFDEIYRLSIVVNQLEYIYLKIIYSAIKQLKTNDATPLFQRG